MKKLMIAACAVAFAAAAQAATFNWTVSSDPVMDGWKGTTVGEEYSSASAQANLNWYLVYAGDYTQADALADFRDGGIDSTKVMKSGTTTADGIAKVGFTTGDDRALTSGKLWAFLVVENTDASSIYISGTQKKTADESGGVVDFTPSTARSTYLMDKDGSNDYSQPGWYAAAVPEPTSGLLLLLGVAGLALKRRRA